MGVPVVFTLVVFLAQLLYGYFVEARRSRDISKRFGEYVPPEIVEEMSANPEAVSMEGKSKEMTVLFSDVRGFTTISEQFKDKPQELSELMNNFLTPLTKVIHRHRGTIDKYMGDAIMAFWGAPEHLPDDAIQACLAAIGQREALAALNLRFRAQGRPQLKLRCGLHRGPAVVGNMGSAQRFAYTAMGDTVNLASRLEGANKFFGTSILISEAVRAAAAEAVVTRRLGRVRVVGRSTPTVVHELCGGRGEVPAAELRRIEAFEKALEVLEAGEFAAAAVRFEEYLREGADPPAERCLRFARERLGAGGAAWDAVWGLTEK